MLLPADLSCQGEKLWTAATAVIRSEIEKAIAAFVEANAASAQWSVQSVIALRGRPSFSDKPGDMSIFNLRFRSRERDDATDARRFGRLTRLLNELTDEIYVERCGLERQYKSETADAAFLLEAIENDGMPVRSNDRVRALTNSIINCERRLDFLKRKAAVLCDFRKALSDLAKQTTFQSSEPRRSDRWPPQQRRLGRYRL